MEDNKRAGDICIRLQGGNDEQHTLSIPISDDPGKVDWQEIGSEIPVLPLIGNALFPLMLMPIQVVRKASVDLLKACRAQGKMFAAASQKCKASQYPGAADLYEYGCVAKVLEIVDMPNGAAGLIQGISRIRIMGPGSSCDPGKEYLTVKYEPCQDIVPGSNDEEYKALIASARNFAIQMVEMNEAIPREAAAALKRIDAPVFLMSFVLTHTQISIENRIEMLKTDSLKERTAMLLKLLATEKEKMKLQGDIQDKVQRKMDKEQREYFLNQQIKAIQKELGADPVQEQLKELEEKAAQKNWPQHAKEAFQKEFQRLKTINPQSPDFATGLSYVQTILLLPWNECTSDSFTIESASETLSKHHYGLEKVKERILEYLAVLKLKNDLKSPILCLYGPPGVGKTSLGKSIAAALGRKYVRMSLGGLYDEAEIRGHRKTYIGAMPGRIIQCIKKAGASNPVFVLDEIDKIESSIHGDPAAALLEALDPEQNSEFHDNYLDLDYDLSKVLFVATANNISKISEPLLDRMEMIEVSGYVTEEKIQIAGQHLVPKTLSSHGIEPGQLKISDSIIEMLANKYTRESGVRELSSALAAIARKAAVRIASGKEIDPEITEDFVLKSLGKPKYSHDEYFATKAPGVVPGMAWTSAGGELLYIESLLCNGNGTLNITGNLGKVMKESAEIALNYLCANEDALGIDHRMFKEYDLSLHFPEGSVPKDGPSAGITIFTALASLYTQRPAKPLIAMTGEITLSGRVLPVGGIKEKILGAKRAGIKHIIMPEENRRDIEEINPLYIKGLDFTYVRTAMELIPLALEEKQAPNPVRPKKRTRKAQPTASEG